MVIELNNIEKKLIDQYIMIYKRKRPDCSFQNVAPSIPFVGNNMKYPRILAYGSAENLTYLNAPKKILDTDIKAVVEENYYRHRSFLTHHKQDIDKFPHIHIQPINDGSLLTVIRYIVEKLYSNSFSYNPFEFIEEISVGNFGKYSINSGKNIDYARNYGRLSESIDFIISDIKEIKPDLIIIPKTISNAINKKNRRNWDCIKKESELNKELKIVRIYQTNNRVINTHIRKALDPIRTNSSLDLFCERWPIKKSIKGLNLYLKWLDQNWDDPLIV